MEFCQREGPDRLIKKQIVKSCRSHDIADSAQGFETPFPIIRHLSWRMEEESSILQTDHGHPAAKGNSEDFTRIFLYPDVFPHGLNISPRIMEWSVQPGVGCRLPIGYSFPDKNRERRQERLSPKRKIPFSIM